MFKTLFSGRVGRLGFLFGSLYYVLSGFIPYIIVSFIYVYAYTSITHKGESHIPLGPMYVLTAFLYAFYIITSLSITARRLNDVERPTWFCIFALVPFVDIPLGIYLLIAPGTDGANIYGQPNPSYEFWNVTLFRELHTNNKKSKSKKKRSNNNSTRS